MAPVLCPTLVGREEELGLVDEFLTRLVSGRGGLLFISGEAGIGKSRLLRAVGDRAPGLELRVLRGRVPMVGTSTPFRPFAEALQSGIQDSELKDPSLESYRSTLMALIGLEETGPIVPEPSLLASMEAVLRALRVMAIGGPVLLLLEDIHAADPETLAVIEYLSDKLRDESIGCIATERSDLDIAAGSLVSTLIARRSADRVVLSPFSAAEVEEMSRQALDVEVVPRGLIDALNLRAEGVPFLVEEMLGAYVAAGGPIERQPEWWVSRRIADGVPHSFREVVRDRLAGLDEDARSVMFAAAALGRAFDWKLLAQVTDLTTGEVLDALRAGVAGHLLISGGDHFATVFEFRHALAREAVLAELLPPERADISLRAARAIEAVYPEVPGDLCDRAAVLYEEGGEPLDAVRLLQEKARRALTRSALESAEVALLHASDLAADDWMVWMGNDDLLLDVYSLAGKPEGLLERGRRLMAAFERYEGHNLAPREASFHLKIARGVLPSGDLETSSIHLDHAGHLADQTNNETLSAQIAAVRGQVAFAGGDLASASAHAAWALEVAERSDLVETRCEALDTIARIALSTGALSKATRASSQLRELSNDPKLIVWKIRALLHLGTIDRLTTGHSERLEQARSLAVSAGAMSTLAVVELELGRVHLDRGAFGDARPFLDTCIEACRVYELASLWEALSASCMAFGLEGRASSVKQTSTEAIAVAPTDAAAADVLANGRAVLALAKGDDKGARQHLSEAVSMGGSGSQAWWRGLHALLDAVISEDTASVAKLESSTAARHRMNAAYLAYADAVAHGRNGDSDLAAKEFTRADGVMAPGWRRHHARRLVADDALARGWGRPIEWATEALEFFDALGLRGLAASCRATLRRAGAPVRRRGRGDSAVPETLSKRGVTSREMDVLSLVADRFSNREIGARLFLSPRTIESHVASLQRKTGVDSRAELAELGRRFQPGSADDDGSS